MSRKFITIEKNFDFSKINMDLSKELNLSGSMIIKDMVDKNRKGLSYNEGTNKLPKREWFGVSDKVEKDILRMIELRIDRILRSA